MVSETLARRYATAVFTLAGEGNAVDAVERDLSALADAIVGDPQTREFFLSPVVDRAEKERVLLSAFRGRVGEVALHALLLLVRKRREPVLAPLLTEYRKLQQAANGAEPLTIASARELSADELRALVARLERLYDRRFDAKQIVDPKLIGGIRITAGDRLIDGTVAGQLENLSRTLFALN